MPEPAFDYTLSPYTGWTRAHWEHVLARVTYGFVRAAEKQGSYARALYPYDYRNLPDAVDALESFARLASAWGAWLSDPQNPATLEFCGRVLNLQEILARALLEGTNANNARTYWGDIGDMDQRIVEAADIALALWLSRERVFNQLSERERAQIIRWLEQVDDKEVYYDNWILFPVLPMTVRKRLGYPVDVSAIDARLDLAAEFYRGDGWYADGAGEEFDLYNAWMFGWHYWLWAWIDGTRRPEYCERLLRRARSFLAGWVYFFGANGSYPAWGRSLVYRFAAVSCFAVGHLLQIAPHSPGMLRRIASGCLKYFYEHDCCDPHEHFLRQGFHGDFPSAAEAYISPGSPSWACHAFLAFAFRRDDPFWTATEEPLPVERGDFELALPAPGFMLSGRRETGQVFLLNAGSGHSPENPRHHYISKYGKLAYTTHFPFNVLPAGETYVPDAMVSLTRNDRLFAHRFVNRAHGVAPGVMWCEFVEYIEDEPQLMRVAVLTWRDVQLRLTYIQSTRRVRAVEAPGALGCAGAAAVMRRSHIEGGWEYAQAEGRALAIRRLWGYDAQRASEPFRGYSNLNLAYPYAEQPLVLERIPRLGARALAAASLLRPAPFDPERELANLAVTADDSGAFEVTFADGERAFVSLANEPPTRILLSSAQRERENAPIEIHGERIRCVRIRANAQSVCAIGVSHIAGICEAEAPGTFQLGWLGDGTGHVTTNIGLQVAAHWFGGNVQRVQVRTLDEAWVDVTEKCSKNMLPTALVREWAERNERTLVEFRLSR